MTSKLHFISTFQIVPCVPFPASGLAVLLDFRLWAHCNGSSSYRPSLHLAHSSASTLLTSVAFSSFRAKVAQKDFRSLDLMKALNNFYHLGTLFPNFSNIWKLWDNYTFYNIPSFVNCYTLFLSIRSILLRILALSQLGWPDQSVNMHIPWKCYSWKKVA